MRNVVSPQVVQLTLPFLSGGPKWVTGRDIQDNGQSMGQRWNTFRKKEIRTKRTTKRRQHTLPFSIRMNRPKILWYTVMYPLKKEKGLFIGAFQYCICARYVYFVAIQMIDSIKGTQIFNFWNSGDTLQLGISLWNFGKMASVRYRNTEMTGKTFLLPVANSKP